MEGKKTFKVKFKKDNDKVVKANDKVVKAIFIDDVMLDYSVDIEALKEISALGIEYKKAALLDIEKHFLKCVCEMIGRDVTNEELAEAFRTGWI